MKKALLLGCLLALAGPSRAWWDPGHMIVAMIAYLNLDEEARQKVDQLVGVLKEDYPQVNHFAVMGPWPDDLKEDEVRTFDTWHYTNLPYNPHNLDLPAQPKINVVWAIRQMTTVLGRSKPAEVEKARHLAFLVHFVGDLHQPMHSTSLHTPELPAGNQGGNLFRLKGKWNNLHALWDDACGLTSALNDIRPYGQPKKPLTDDEIDRIGLFARELMLEHPKETLPAYRELDPERWALESHDLAVQAGYRTVVGLGPDGQALYLQPGTEPNETYLEQGQEVARRQLTLAGYRLAELLNRLFERN